MMANIIKEVEKMDAGAHSEATWETPDALLSGSRL